MRVLLASSSSGSRGGGEIYLLYLGRALAARGHEVTIWASSHEHMDALAAEFSSIGSVPRSDYVNTYNHQMRSLATLFNRQTAHRIAREWLDAAPDIVHVNKQNLEDGLDLLRSASATELPAVCTIHLTQSARYLGAKSAGSHDLAARWALRRFRGEFISVQERRASDLTEFLRQGGKTDGRIHTVHNGVPVPKAEDITVRRSEVRASLGLPDNAQLILGVARLMPQKRLQVFLDKAKETLTVYPDARFLWIGCGYLDGAWDGWVRERGLQEAVDRLPWTRDVPGYLVAADAFLHTAEYEGMPLAIFEAMAHGLPCLLTPNLLEDMPFLGPNTAIAAGSPGWLNTLTQPDALARIGAASRRLVIERFSVDAMAAATTVQVYQAALARCQQAKKAG